MPAACKDGTVTSTTLSTARVTPPPATVKAVQQPRDRCAECAPPPTGVTLRRRRRAAHPRRVQLRDPALCLRLQGPVQPAGRRCSPDGHAGRRRPQPNLGERSMATLLTLLQKPAWLFRNATPRRSPDRAAALAGSGLSLLLHHPQAAGASRRLTGGWTASPCHQGLVLPGEPARWAVARGIIRFCRTFLHVA